MSDRTFRLSASDIDKAFERNEFRVVFQPKVDLASERVTGAEVFVRWQHPQYGLLPPGLFLDFVEANGRMPDLTGFVFHAALDGAKRWKAAGKDWAVSINVAPGTVTSQGFCEGLARLLKEYGLEPQRVIIEVPERAIAQEPETLCEALLEVREMGVHVALDGGGIVPVDLGQFVPIPFTSIKVGGPASIRLAQRLGLRGKGAIAARLRFAHQYNLEAVAVGAEDEATMAGLADVGFTAAQGIWIQKPMPLDDLLKWDGKWARGRVSMDPMPVAAQPQPKRAETKPAVAGPKDETKKEPVSVKRAGLLQQKPEQKAASPIPAMEFDPSELADIVEDEEAAAPPVKRQGFGAPAENCPPMKTLVQRKPGKGDGAQTRN